MSSGKLLLGVLAGAAAGAVLGILFAPDKGSVTRSKISKKSRESIDHLKDKFSDFIDNVADNFEEAKDEAASLVASGKAKANEIKRDVKSSFS